MSGLYWISSFQINERTLKCDKNKTLRVASLLDTVLCILHFSLLSFKCFTDKCIGQFDKNLIISFERVKNIFGMGKLIVLN